jgi:hypothetical protein
MPEAHASGFFLWTSLVLMWENQGVKTIRISGKLYSKLRQKAKAAGCTMDSLIVQVIGPALPHDKLAPQRRKPRIIHSKRPGTLHSDNARIFEIIYSP